MLKNGNGIVRYIRGTYGIPSGAFDFAFEDTHTFALAIITLLSSLIFSAITMCLENGSVSEGKFEFKSSNITMPMNLAVNCNSCKSIC